MRKPSKTVLFATPLFVNFSLETYLQKVESLTDEKNHRETAFFATPLFVNFSLETYLQKVESLKDEKNHRKTAFLV